MKTPYIGITDFMSAEQARAMLSVFSQQSINSVLQRKLMVGVMMSYKTLVGIYTRWTKAFPSNDAVAKIFVSDPPAFNTLHYADYDGIDVVKCLPAAVQIGGENIHALQLDMIWPDPVAIEEVSRQYPDLQIILQVGKNAFQAIGDDVAGLLSRLEQYGEHLDYVLLDRSMGRGLPMEPERLRPFLRALKHERPDLGLAVAGGLGPNTVQVVQSLVSEFPSLSIDAQGRLRPSGDALNEPIDWNMAEEYLRKAIDIFR